MLKKEKASNDSTLDLRPSTQQHPVK